jgi:quinol monooxygenase YgiN
MFAVITRVTVEPGSIDELASLFDETNRQLVAKHNDWKGVWFTANRERSEVTVIAHWSDAASYERLRASDEYAQVMGRFATRFAGSPEVTINELLVEM